MHRVQHVSSDTMAKIGMHCHLLAKSPNILKDSKHAKHLHIYFTSKCSVQQA